jgi:prolipoprotein diacylglyceryltransferase
MPLEVVPTDWPGQSVWVGVGILVSFALTASTAPKERRGAAVSLLGMVGVAAIVGGRLLWALADPQGPLQAGGGWLSILDPRIPGFASFGAIWGGALVGGIVVRGLPEVEPLELLDRVVPAGFVGLAFARFGCLVDGCDFGGVTTHGWSVVYPAGSRVWQLQREAGLIDATAAWSLGVHPFPIYLVGGTVGAVAGGWCLARGRFEHPGAYAAATAICYLAGRSVIEWVRSPLNATPVLGGWVNLNQVFSVVTFGLLVLAIGRYLGEEKRDSAV